MLGLVMAVAHNKSHNFSKKVTPDIELVAGLGVAGDAHQGITVKHRSRVAADPTLPNLRQVHLIHSELFNELSDKGFKVESGDLGENITTVRLDLLALPPRTLLHIGKTAVVRVTGLRNPCAQIDRFRPGLLAALLDRRPDNDLIRKAGIMAVVQVGGVVRAGDSIEVNLPPLPHQHLECV
jgi:MOSC domain-containing protein YiiM